MRTKPNPFRPKVERLERRDVPSTLTISLVDGELIVQGTDDADGVTIYRQEDRYLVDVGSAAPVDGFTYHETLEFDLADLQGVRFTGLGGNDAVMDLAGLRVWADLGAGDDQAYVLGDSTIFGGDGDDSIFMDWYAANEGSLYADGGAGADWICGGDRADTLIGGAGVNSLHGWGGDDLLVGGDDVDILYGMSGSDTLYGFGGNDTLIGNFDWPYGHVTQIDVGNDLLSGGDGDDDLIGGGIGSHVVFGGNGNDYMMDGMGDDRLYGEAGDDTMNTSSGNDVAHGGDGNDFLQSTGGGSDWLFGEAGDDVLYSTTLTTRIAGGSGYDYLSILYWSADYQVNYSFTADERGLMDAGGLPDEIIYWGEHYSIGTDVLRNHIGALPRDEWSGI